MRSSHPSWVAIPEARYHRRNDVIVAREGIMAATEELAATCGWAF
jgi:hypothetical protein